MSEHPEAMAKYRAALERQQTLEETLGDDWKSYVNRPKIVSWMSSHCGTNSKREAYIDELSKYMKVDKYVTDSLWFFMTLGADNCRRVEEI